MVVSIINLKVNLIEPVVNTYLFNISSQYSAISEEYTIYFECSFQTICTLNCKEKTK